MRTVHVIGIGAGDPEHLTVQAIARLTEVDAFLLLDKGESNRDLLAARQALLDRYRPAGGYRLRTVAEVDRDRMPADYTGTVADWHRRRGDLYERFIRDDLRDGEVGGILCWGDPTLYDNTAAVLDEVLDRGTVTFEHTIVPGISSVSALAAAHRISLNRPGRPVHITTGRLLAAQGVPAGVDDVVVLLDSRDAYATVDPAGLHIYWGAYLGTADQLTLAGPLADLARRIPTVRAEARTRKGWIMDTYLLRRSDK